jgi:hypothetical protein
MKKVILLLLLMPCPVFGQIVQNFEQESINSWFQSPESRWKADSTGSLSGCFSLHHIFDNTESGTDCIGLPLKGLHPEEGNVKWSFVIRHGYDPSSSNKWLVFLLSDAGPGVFSGNTDLNGFAIGVNLTGSDDTLRLSKIKDGVISTVVSTSVNWQTQIGISEPALLTVERTSSGFWTVIVNRLRGELAGSGSGVDKELFTNSWFGIRYTYSSTRDKVLWFDDLTIGGIFHDDLSAPVVTECRVTGKNSIDLFLSEKPSGEFCVASNFSLQDGGNIPITALMESELVCRIRFRDDFVNKKALQLKIKSLCDLSGNCNTDTNVTFTPVRAEAGDVIISEIMADPFPGVSLPAKEFVEIKNRTAFPLNLLNWKLSAKDQGTLFPDITVDSSGYIIVCSVYDTALFAKYGQVAGVKSFPVLTDGGTILTLSDSLGNFIHGVEYSSKWYGDELRADGGWSLEIVDTGYPFYYDGNWKASLSRSGGTPGTVNSTNSGNPDTEFLGISNVFASDSLNIIVTFSEPVLDITGLRDNLRVDGKKIGKIITDDRLMRRFIINISEALLHHKKYKIDFSEGISDFAGNMITKKEYGFGLAEPSLPGNILFNELLFNPLPGDPDFIEFYNCSTNIIDASRLQVVSVNDQTGDISQPVMLSEEHRCFMPGTYYAITTDRKRVVERYFSADPENVFEIQSLPAMNDDEGHLLLYNRELDVIDNVKYDEDQQYSLLVNNEGVALEKISPLNNSAESSGWHSASESSGWGTPGAPNSVYTLLPGNSDEIVLSTSKITPDGDGNEDNLVIELHPEGTGNIVSVSIFDETGSSVRKLVTNMLMGAETTIIWDGTAGDGSPVNTGIYVILISIYDDKGKAEKLKKVCTVLR